MRGETTTKKPPTLRRVLRLRAGRKRASRAGLVTDESGPLLNRPTNFILEKKALMQALQIVRPRLMLLNRFNAILARRPLLTQMVVSGAVCGAGDVFAQYITKEPRWDVWRTARFTFLGTFIIAPPLNVWFRVLERITHPNKSVAVVKRMMVDQLMFGPCLTAVILTSVKLLEGDPPAVAISKMKEVWGEVYINSLKIWPAVQLFNFYVMPLNYRVLVVQLAAFFWNSYISYRTQLKE
ncbi:unnamed protein product [Caenorhabditis bovis]|uniref:Mitochondrial inner membrane protein Mpv17 n=1 Tax=Caenorhabditis bovis TaxID=2654633 RepID=A0A8S1F5R2_9PELO|nr:unnamed protein product [Caenorhabditis bovis]